MTVLLINLHEQPASLPLTFSVVARGQSSFRAHLGDNDAATPTTTHPSQTLYHTWTREGMASHKLRPP